MLSVVAATYNRAALLDRALATYARQTLPRDRWEYVLVDDLSQDDTLPIVLCWQQRGLPIRYFTSTDVGKPKAPGVWRDGCVLRNAGSTFAFGRHLVMTHPEILIPPQALALMDAALAREDKWWTAIPYWLPRMPDAAWADPVLDWQADLHALHGVPGFYDPDWPTSLEAPGAIDYRNQHQERRETWESEVFWGMRMSTWRAMGGFREFTKWGSVDMDFLSRRHLLEIPTAIVRDPDSVAPSKALMVYHQFHDAPRAMDEAMAELKGAEYRDREAVKATGGLTPIYHHGHRERAREGQGILRDHVLRYEWVAFHADLLRGCVSVLDLPCGTGYGSALLAKSGCFDCVTGMDLDEESLDFAARTYRTVHLQFVKGDLQNIPLPSASVDAVTCFEGLEHIPNPQQALQEIHRVLRPQSVLYLSTPQQGVAQGTAWDRYMLDYERLTGLLTVLNFEVRPFHQMFYGGEHPVRTGHSPQAEIMLALAVKR